MQKILLLFFLVVTCTAINAQENKLQSFWVHFNSTPVSKKMIEEEPLRRQIIFLNAWEYHLIPQFKKVNPDVKVLVYKDLSSTRDYHVKNGKDDELLPAGVGYIEAQQHPEWFLKDDDGKQLYYSGYGGHAQMDVGNKDYQTRWINNVVQELNKNGWDGVFLDNALFAPDEYHSGVFPKQYKTPESFQTVYLQFLKSIDNAFKKNNKISIANMSSAKSFPGMWEKYLNYLDGGFDEWWLVYGKRQLADDRVWRIQFEEVLVTDKQNKLMLVQPHSAMEESKDFFFALATYWLGNNGNTYFSDQRIKDNYGDPQSWYKEYEWDMGKPLGQYYEYSDKVNLYRRDFQKATVLVNTSANKTYSIKLKRKLLDHNGKKLKKVIMEPQSGAILRRP